MARPNFHQLWDAAFKMNFEFDDQQKAFKAHAEEVFQHQIVPIVDAYPPDEPIPKDASLRVLQHLRQLGMLGARIPKDSGGSGLGAVGLGILAETLPYYAFSTGLGTDVLITHVFRSGTDQLKQRLLPELLSGKKFGGDANSEPNVGSDPRGIQTKAVPAGDQYVINGTKLWASSGTVADALFVTVSMGKDEKGMNILTPFVVEKDSSPFVVRSMPTIGHNRAHLAEVVFEDCRVPKENMLIRADAHAHRALTAVWLSQRAIMGLASVHCAQKALESTIQYAKKTKRYSKPVGSFQTVQGMIAEMASLIEASRLLSYKALNLIEKGAWCARESSMAKYFATESGVKVISMAVQIQGAYALSQDQELQRVFRDARMTTIPAGTVEINRLILGRELLGISAFV